MAYSGKFLVNNAPLSPLTIFGIGTFNAFSGNHQYRNQGGCTALPNDGPIPAGKYWIVDRPTSGIRSQAYAWAKDTFNSTFGTPSDHFEWFALYRDDGMIDDVTWVGGVKRGQFRLHPAGGAGVSLGCITLPSRADFLRIRSALLRTMTIPAGSSGGARQASCRLTHAARGCLFALIDAISTTESRSGLSVTAPTGVQLRVWRDQRAGLRSRALSYSACRAARSARSSPA
ncbi:hypothetical protein HDG34_001360 [Paraburkholderia sp. HC6.4b]|nr:hypothetical protein [Paraburkholderia sp. HC6.4b]MBB5453817.1 hypothetical protein [Paraburkholderia sp. Kb1A]